MVLDRYKLQWMMDTLDKWKIVYIGGDGGGAGREQPVKLDGLIGSKNAKIWVNGAHWGTGTYSALSDMVEAGTTVKDSTGFTIKRAVCLVCTVTPPVPPAAQWIAWQDPPIDSHIRNLMSVNKWSVAASNIGDVPEGGEVTFGAGKVKVGAKEWGSSCTYDANLDQVKGKLTSDLAKDVSIIRRTSLICIMAGSSGGNSWVAVEGG